MTIDGALMSSRRECSSTTGQCSPERCLAEEFEEGKYVVSIYDIMRGIKINLKQILILAYGALSYSHFVKHLLLVTMSQASLWEHWPELERNPVRYNSVIAGQAFAWLVGSLYLLPLQDYYGRRNLFLICNIVPLLLTIGSAFAPSFEIYAIFRCLSVLTVASAGAGANIYVIELVNPKLRHTATWLEMVVSSIEIMYLILCKFSLERTGRSVWNWIQFYGLLPSLLGVLIGSWLFLECPGFQILYKEHGISKAWRTLDKVAGGPDEVDRILRQIPLTPAKSGLETTTPDPDTTRPSEQVFGGEPIFGGEEMTESVRIMTCYMDEPVRLIKPEIRRELVEFAEAANRTGQVVSRESVWTFIDIRPVVYSWFELFKKRETRSDTSALCVMWFGEAFCHWGIMSYCTLFYETIGYDANLMNIIAYLIQIPLHFLIMDVMAKIRNERLVLGIATITAAAFTTTLAILMTLRNEGVHTNADHVLAVLAVLVAVNGCIISGPLLAFTAQRYPIGVRASASGLMSGINSLSLIASSYLSSLVIRSDRIQYMLYANALLRIMVACVIFGFITTTRVTTRILDFQH